MNLTLNIGLVIHSATKKFVQNIH